MTRPLTTSEVCRKLNLHENTVRRWSNQGIIKSFRIGPRRDRRFLVEDIKNLMESGKSSKID